MKTASLFVIVLGFNVGVVTAQQATVELEQKPLPPLPNSISGSETVTQRMNAYLKQEGFRGAGEQTLPDGRTAFIALGEGVIEAAPTAPNFVQARQNAFYKALIEAKMKCAEFQQVSIASEMTSEMGEPGEARATAEARRLEREGLAREGAVQVARALNSDLKASSMPSALQTAGVVAERLLNSKMREELTKKGIDPDRAVSEQQLKPVLASNSFSKMARAVAAERCTGIQVMASFEQTTASGRGGVGVVTVYTRKLHEIADAIVSGHYGLVPTGQPGLPVDAHVPADLRNKLTAFGTRLVRDDKGDYVLLSFAQAQPASNSAQTRQIAYRAARLLAQSQIRLFLGAQVQSHNEIMAGESTVERMGEDPATIFNTEKNSNVKVVADKLPIRGIQEIDSWETLHPAGNAPVVGVVMQWKASSAQFASAVRGANQASGAIANSVQRDGLPPAGASTAAAPTKGAPATPRTGKDYSGESSTKTRDF